MNDTPARDSDAAPQLTALNGMRFFAVFHIFLYHLWSVRFESPRQRGALGQCLRQHGQLPVLVQQPDCARLSIHQLLLPALGIHPGVPVLDARRRAGDDPAIFLVAALDAHLSRAPDRPRHHDPAHVAAVVLRPGRAVDSARRRERRGHGDADAGVGAAAGADLELAHLGAVRGGVSLSHHAVAHARAVEALARPADRLVSGEPADFARAHAHLPAVLSRWRQGPG